jgi:putative ABC transport system permease protein
LVLFVFADGLALAFCAGRRLFMPLVVYWGMIFHHLRSAWRAIRHNRLFSLISIGCLAIGMAVSLTILLYVLHEHSFEKWQANAGRIYSVEATMHYDKGIHHLDGMSYSMGPVVRSSDPDVEDFVRVLSPLSQSLVRNPAKPELSASEKGKFIYADSNFYRFFSLGLVRGNPGQVLVRPFTIVLTRRAARKFFGDDDPIGKRLRVDEQYDFEVTGVAANPPSNTDFQYDFIASMASTTEMPVFGREEKRAEVQAGAFDTWFRLRNAQSRPHVEKTIGMLVPSSGDKTTPGDEYYLAGLTDHHLKAYPGMSSDMRYLSVFPVVAGLILLLAVVNYMSLATARSTSRAKEVGVRKVLGAGRGQIAGQFYVESALSGVLAFVLGACLFLLLRRYFLRILGTEVDGAFLFSTQMLTGMAGLLVATVLTAGIYPSLVLSAFRPVAVLYGKLTRGRGGERVRKGFIVFQFTISMVLVLCSILIQKQLYYLRHTETGINRENVVMVPFSKQLNRYSSFKQEVDAIPGVRETATCMRPLYGGTAGITLTIPGTKKETLVNQLLVDDHFIPMLGLRWVNPPIAAQGGVAEGSPILNETAAEQLGFTGDPVGQLVNGFRVEGVVKNFNYEGLRMPVGPLCLFVEKDTSKAWSRGCMLVKIGAHVNVPGVISRIEQIYKRHDKANAFEFHFADEAFEAQYKAEDRLAGLMGLFTGVTIVIACLGLFALATFATQQRVKEIGIRKVLGASVASINGLLSKDFLRPVLLAIAIACPLAWWLMQKWLQEFAYRTSVSWWVFVAAGLGLLGVALGTVLFRTFRAAWADPVENLRVQ